MGQIIHRMESLSPTWLYGMVFIVPLSVVVGHAVGGAWYFLTPLVVFGVIPLMDHLIGIDPRNPFPQDKVDDNLRTAGTVITWVCAPVQLLLIFWGAGVIAGGNLDGLEALGLTLSVGVSSGVMGINASHELQHRVNHPIEVLFSRMILMSVGYMHWAVEHVAGHHRNVATPRDPATARLGESVYQFLPRTIRGGFASACRIEAQRLARQKKPPRFYDNRILRYMVAQGLFVVLLMSLWGWTALPYWLLQSAVAISLLEVINYVEHYGLRRRRAANGFAPVRVRHSWNSSHWLTNHFLFNLQRHADHHYRPGRRYPYLRHFEESPQLPTGYAGMILLALVPPLWQAVMDKRVKAVADDTRRPIRPGAESSPAEDFSR
jgi:alkane 1-monooxygenase